jgi:hypothetical protein
VCQGTENENWFETDTGSTPEIAKKMERVLGEGSEELMRNWNKEMGRRRNGFQEYDEVCEWLRDQVIADGIQVRNQSRHHDILSTLTLHSQVEPSPENEYHSPWNPAGQKEKLGAERQGDSGGWINPYTLRRKVDKQGMDSGGDVKRMRTWWRNQVVQYLVQQQLEEACEDSDP